MRVLRVITDNGSYHVAKTFAAVCHKLGLGHSRTRSHRPRSNGKAGRFIQTLLGEWADAFPFNPSVERGELLPVYLHFYNWHRGTRLSLASPPSSRLNLYDVV